MQNTIDLETNFPLYLLAEKGVPSCERIGKILGITGDKVLREMTKKILNGSDLYRQIMPYIQSFIGGILAVDDSVQDRLRSHESKADLIGQHYSGNHKAIVNGVDIVTMFRVQGNQRLPLNFRILDLESGKTKHDLLREMLDEILGRGFKPLLVSADSFYSTNQTIAKLIQKGIGLFMGIKSNRLAREVDSFEKNASYWAISTYSISSEGKVMHVRGLGLMKVFRFDDRNYIYHSGNDATHLDIHETKNLTREQAQSIQRSHRCIEEYHRVLKQLCNLEGMIFRQAKQILNHIFYALKAYCILEITRQKNSLQSRYHSLTNDTLSSTQILFSKLSLQGLHLLY